jgi:hypothetical protein
MARKFSFRLRSGRVRSLRTIAQLSWYFPFGREVAVSPARNTAGPESGVGPGPWTTGGENQKPTADTDGAGMRLPSYERKTGFGSAAAPPEPLTAGDSRNRPCHP